ncbi:MULTISPECIES: phage tail protein [unclassified Leptolyngbya]|uniref:phage tail protein n=1 Tax=unclassified Leptolyngbya TaxID=2650499 RepID=UPI00168653A2|nr:MULTISPECIES: phage tail protein [unclassified Leptolyngbya]MBD1909765.1 phage tail protein [Leptolyngbya sp. FACHB-8]MBD2157663.1 phage tail protein [Leptolyngbya sp. FACHB-16]
MTLSYTPSLTLQATSTHIPEALATVTISLSGGPDEQASNQLLLHPGEPSAIAIHVENHSDRPLRWSLETKGDFPSEWCQWQVDVPVLAFQQRLDRTIEFQVPHDFFERSEELGGDRSHLQLNYQSEVFVYIEHEADGKPEGTPTSRQLVGYQVFTLHVRPPSPYLNFLPALYRENDFIGRFLAIIEQAFDPVVQTMDQMWAYLDPLTAPEALLPFLAHWVGWTTDTQWTVQQQRRLIRHAVTLYRWHGTRQGLRFYLHLYTGLPLDEHVKKESEKHICIEEVFSYGFVVNQAAIGEDAMLGGGRPYHFIVRLRLNERASHIHEDLIRKIIDSQKPAFCTYDLYIEQPTICTVPN